MCEYEEGRKTKLDETIQGEGYRIERPIDDSIPNVVHKRNLHACVYVYACFAGIILQLGICA